MSSLIDTQQHYMSRSDRIKKATCQLYNTYLPESYLPATCKNHLEDESWAWNMINTVFVGSITIFNTTILLIITFLWLVNRQFHFSKKRHSYDKEQKPAKLLRLSKAKLKKAAKKLKRKKSVAQIHREEQESEAAMLLAEQKKHKSFQSFLDVQDCDEDDEEDNTVIEKSLDIQHKKQQPYRSTNTPTGTSTRPPLGLHLSSSDIAKKKRTKDLLQLASKIEVFSYLSPEAVIDILEYVEYVDFKNIGDVVFDTHTLDGSMYAVVSGEVTTSLSVEETGNKEDFSFVAAPGEVITSMLSIVTSLVREYQLQDELIHLFNGAGGVGGSIGGVGQISNDDVKKVFIPPGMNIQAVVTAPNTRLLRIPSRCFVAILEKFPLDVHNICQTILSRLQRVTIQTLVRFLGLDAGILGVGGPSLSSSDGIIPIKPLRNSTAEWSKLEQSLLSGSSDTSTASSILEEATSAAASLLGMSADTSHELNEGAEIIHASSGSVICSKGQPLDGIYLILKGQLEVGLDQSKQQSSTPQKASQGEILNHKKATRSKRVSTLSSSSSRSFSSFDEHDENSSFKPLFSAAPGNWVGLFSCFTKDSSFITAHATSGALLLKIPAKTFHAVVSKYPRVLIHTLLDIIDTGKSFDFNCLV